VSAAKVVLIRDPVVIAIDMLAEISEVMTGVPYDDLRAGFKVEPETRVDLWRMIRSLQEIRRIAHQARDRDLHRFEAFSEQVNARGG
jgi:hypothetical protein